MARDGISVDSSPRDLMASTNSERAVTEGCSDPRTTNLELQASETRAHCSKPTEPKCAPGFLVVPAQGRHDEVAMFDTHAACADTVSCSANGGRRRKGPRSGHWARGILKLKQVNLYSRPPHEVEGATRCSGR